MSSDYNSRSRERRRRDTPDCFKDPEVYDEDDEECRHCPVFATCGTLVASQLRRERNENRGRRGVRRTPRETHIATRKRTEIEHEYEEPEEDDTFGSVLLHNSTLNALQGITQTLNEAVGHIPRKSYENVFFSLKKKKKKRD